jgi:hypothetical protein
VIVPTLALAPRRTRSSSRAVSASPIHTSAPEAHLGGPENPAVRGDMVFFETPNDGAVFAVGSITWFGSLSYNMDENPMSRITDNVVRAFVSDDWPER